MTSPLAPDVPAVATFAPPEGDATIDARIRSLIERYARLVGASVHEMEPHLLELAVPEAEAQWFRGAHSLRVALSLAAFEQHPDAEMAVLGSAFLQQLIEAVRSRGQRFAAGLVPPTLAPEASAATLTVPVGNASASPAAVSFAVQPLGRLRARVVVSAGAVVVERLVESSVFDLAEGVRAGADLAALCTELEAGRLLPAAPEAVAHGVARPPREPDALLPAMLGDLETKISADLERQRADAARTLATELARLDGYYTSLLTGPGAQGTEAPSADARRAIEAEHARRRTEEERRHEVKATVHPLQLIEFEVLTQRAEWTLTTASGHHGALAARRAMSGDGSWALACPSCGETPSELLVCRHNHVACDACASTCGVCGEGACGPHGLIACHVDVAPACGAHARMCTSCRRAHCTAHEARCADGDHPVCSTCVAPCAVCARLICDAHASTSTAAAPRGARRLCANCVVLCEGGTNEPVGVDEATRCASCARFVCEHHQVRCVIDEQVHCSAHLRRSDLSRRLVCAAHQAACDQEPAAIFATDEVAPCTQCGAVSCDRHAAPCATDGRRYCTAHLAPLADLPGKMACDAHRTVCHVDGQAYSPEGTAPCPVCARRACRKHRPACALCGRYVCNADRDPRSGRCTTCSSLAVDADPADRLLAAAIMANDGSVPTAKTWRTARDASHIIAELDLGWTRRLVFALPHGDTKPSSVMRHSILGAWRISG